MCVEKPGVGVVCEERPYICQACDATGFSQEDLIMSSGAFISESSQLDFAACTLSCSNEPKCAHATFLPKMHSCILREEGLMQSMATSARVRNEWKNRIFISDDNMLRFDNSQMIGSWPIGILTSYKFWRKPHFGL